MAHARSQAYQPFQVFFGDLHNHCNISYGRGSLADALHNAQLQLDFASVTVHAVWPDLPTDEPELDYLVEYHREGFAKARNSWPAYLNAIDDANQPGRFVTFPSFEWHSLTYGDYCVYYPKGDGARIIDAADLSSLRSALRAGEGPPLLIPHHIGYRCGARGINWEAFTTQLSPVVEIFSFHGLSESSEGPYPYLHSMGPRHELSTAQYGWSQGHVFGVVGSTDHHNSFPGSYGYGRMGVWAEALSREAIWKAILARRTYALTGDRIELAFALNEQPMGSISPAAEERWIEVAVDASASIDYIEVLHNNRVIHRESILPVAAYQGRYKLFFELGWGEQSEATSWDVTLDVEDGVLLDAEPHFRGFGPTDTPQTDEFTYASWQRSGPNQVHFQTRTQPNPSLHTAATEGMVLEIDGDRNTRIVATVNGKRYTQPLCELWRGACTFNLGGFVSPAFCFHRATPRQETSHRHAFLHHRLPGDARQQPDWYYVRVRARNNQWAWSSPIWVEEPTAHSSKPDRTD
jgi:hypothetical protein